MQSLELQPTPENILETYLEDSIGRNASVRDFIATLSTITGHYSLALDGSWGSGKSFFVNQVKMLLDEYNPFMKPEENEQLREVFTYATDYELEVLPHVSVYYDSWINDNDEDPMLSLIYSIVKSTQLDFNITEKTDYINVAASIASAVFGRNISDIVNSLQSEKPLKGIESQKKIEDSISTFFDKLLEERGERLVIFIDELDRCKPTFAVKLLERIKHYFMHDRVTFVFSVNLEELQHTIRQLYGTDFSASKYLDRFFDFKVTLPVANREKYCENLCCKKVDSSVNELYKFIIKKHNFELRDIAKFMTNIKRITDEFDKIYGEHKLSYNTTKQAEMHSATYVYLYIVPIFIGLKLTDKEKYQNFIKGKDFSSLGEYLECKSFFSVSNSMLSVDFMFESNIDRKSALRLSLEKVYKVLTNTVDSENLTFGRVYVNDNVRGALKYYTNFI